MRQIKWGIRVAWICVVLGFLVAVPGVCQLSNQPKGITLDGLASIGSFLQGTVASFWSLGGLLLIYVAFLSQKQQLIRQDAELEDQKKQFEIQNASIRRQSFESSFFQLLNLQNQIASQMRIKKQHEYYAAGPSMVTTTQIDEGRVCFQHWYSALKGTFQSSATLGRNREPAIELSLVVESYLQFYKNHQGELGHYIRNLYYIFKFVADSQFEDKRRYTGLARAQLSAYELALLFYNGINPLGEKFKQRIEEFGLLENLDRDLLFDPKHAEFYSENAYR